MSRPIHPAACSVALAALAGLAFGVAPPRPHRANESAPPAYRVSGPFSHENLTIFLLHGDDQLKGKKFLTLDEALAAKKAVVHETKNVGQLAIENVSDEEVFVQAGDIVKGGQQDRTLAVDLIVPAKSGKVPVASFCVEQGRWNQREKEDYRQFGSSKDNLVGNQLKLACRMARNQGQVWRNVEFAQQLLASKLKGEVKDSKSKTSLQLTLENRKLLETIATYVKKLEAGPHDGRDVIGYAAVINGKVVSADVYANAALFRKLWPKLLKGSAVEAIAEKDDKLKFKPATAADVLAFLADPEKGKASEKPVNRDLKEVQKETEKNVLIETYLEKKESTESRDKTVLRRSYLAK